MRKEYFLYITIIFSLFYSCVHNPAHTDTHAEENRINMRKLEKGMSQDKFYSIMGNPDRQEMVKVDSKAYEIWFYMTKGLSFGQTEYIRDNFTPFIFKNKVLKGWGYRYYDYLLNIDNARGKVQQDKRQEYTNDRDEWPPNEHKIIPPQQPQKDQKKQPAQKQPDKKQNNSPCPVDKEEERGANYHLWE